MPRIDPHQLLKCLSVLLSTSGGIKSKDEVKRLASLMTKFSKKLVSKCIYVLILKSTEVDLLDMFMSEGGWDLTYSWLSDGIQAKNWALVGELVELLIMCPVDIERLKGNNCPKLIKLLSKDPTATTHVRELACKVVEQWLAIVKGACEAAPAPEPSAQEPMEQEEAENSLVEEDSTESEAQIPVYKITIRDGKQVLAEVISERATPRVDNATTAEAAQSADATSPHTTKMEDSSKEESEEEEEEIIRRVVRKRGQPPKKDPPKKKATKRPSPDPEFKPEKKPREKKTKHSEPSLDSRKKDKSNKLKEKSKSAKDDAQNEKDRATLAKLISPPITNLGKIPKKVHKEDSSHSDEKKSEEKKPERKPVEPPKPPPKDPKKYNISVEPRKGVPATERPKTVKMFNSKFRSTGLEEVPPPPKSKKNGEEERRPPKRSSPTKDTAPVPEKRPKEEKVAPSPPPQPPKPKINFLKESDVFADALIAANPVKDVKKKKRRVSLSEKDKKDMGKGEDKKSHEPVKPALKFYQDTLMTSEDKGGEGGDSPEGKDETKSKMEIKEENLEDPDDCNQRDGPSSPSMSKEELEDEVAKAEEAITQVLKQEEKKNVEREKNRLPRGILAYIKKKRINKKSVQWKPEAELEETKYFELDETERVNVTKPFGDMKQMERISERENILLSRKLAADDVMEEKICWRPLLKVEVLGEQIIPGKNSLEKDIQFARERTTLQAIYFNRRMIPDCPAEPDLEIHATTEPAIIPLDDQTGNAESVITYRHKPWPEPKGYPPGIAAGAGLAVGGHQPGLPAGPPGYLDGSGSPLGPPQAGGFIPPPASAVMPPGFYPPNPGFPGQGMPPNPMPTPQPPPPEWAMGGGEGGSMMGGGPDMMMGPPGLLGAGPEIYGMGPPPPEFMGPPPPPHFMGPPMFTPFHPQGPPDMRAPRPPWFRQNGPSNPGTWRHPSKGGGGGGGGSWGKARGVCNNYMKKGGCRTKQCPYRHPPPPR